MITFRKAIGDTYDYVFCDYTKEERNATVTIKDIIRAIEAAKLKKTRCPHCKGSGWLPRPEDEEGYAMEPVYGCAHCRGSGELENPDLDYLRRLLC